MHTDAKLTKRDRTAFVKALLKPSAPPNEKLKAAAKRLNRMVKPAKPSVGQHTE